MVLGVFDRTCTNEVMNIIIGLFLKYRANP